MGFMDWFLKPLDNPPKTGGDVRAQALANMRAARERIGDDEIQKMALSLKQENLKAMAQRAKAEIQARDKAEVATRVKAMLKEDR